MKKCYILIGIVLVFALYGCKDYSVSYLSTKNLRYPLNSLTVVKGLTEEDMYEPQGEDANGEKKESKYKERITHKSPWISSPFWGATVEGARPLKMEVESVKTKGEKADAEKLKKHVTIYGEGVISVPFDNDIPIGEYLLSLRISNIADSQVVEDCFTIIVTDKKW